jgi:hypothetical protein
MNQVDDDVLWEEDHKEKKPSSDGSVGSDVDSMMCL